jgi:ribosomal protein S18 acetylase RimI-like enzyme
MHIRTYKSADLDALIALSLRAWAPVFASLANAMEGRVFERLHPDWRESQRAAVSAACSGDLEVVVAEDATPVGFAALKVHAEAGLGEVYMIAVDPPFQRRGIARSLMQFAVASFERQGLGVGMIDTGGDEGHAPARKLYEALGFKPLPIVRYFRAL